MTSITDEVRMALTVARYDFWLDLRGAGMRQRRHLRQELRANLRDAAADVGLPKALLGIGSPKALAYAAMPVAKNRPRWSVAGLAATMTFAALTLSLMLSMFAFVDGVVASGVTGREVTGTVFPWFGLEFVARVEEAGKGLSVGVGGAPWVLVGISLVVFILVARPWRLVLRASEVEQPA